MTVIYADLYFVINYAADYLIMIACSRFLGRKIKCMRIIFASLLGAAYALAAMYYRPDGIMGILLNFTVCCLMCLVCVGKSGKKTLFRFVCSFYILSFMLGGFLTALSNLMIAASIYINKSVPLYILLFISALICFVFMTVGKRFSSKMSIKKVMTEIHAFGKSGNMSLMCDTGNVAIDPYSGKYVIVVKISSLEKIFGKDILKIEKGFENIGDVFAAKLRLIPVKTAVGHGLMTAFTPDKLCIVTNKGRIEAEACIAVDFNSQNDYLGADGVVPFSLVEDLI